MDRFYLPPEACQGPTLKLTGAEAHHALRVLRVRVGEPVVVLDGARHAYLCDVAAVDQRSVTLAVRECQDLPLPAHRVTLVQAVTKGRSMDWIVQKATELAVHRLVPVLTEHSVPHVGQEDAARKADRWRDIAIEALKQCGAPWLPEIAAPRPLPEFLAGGQRFDLALVASLASGAAHPRRHLTAYRAAHGRAPVDIAVWVGPEGDFTAAELAAIGAAGAQPITLGSQVLRSETAAVYCLAFLSYEGQSP